MPYALARDVTGWGSSSTAGNQDGTGTTIFTRIDSLTDGPGIMRNKGAGGTNSAQILTAVTAGTAQEKAGDTIFQFGGNGFNNAGDDLVHYNDYVSAIGQIGHANFLAWISHNSATEIYGSGTWGRSRKLHRRQWNRDPGKAVDLSYLMRYAPPADATDSASQATDVCPDSYRHDAGHLNQKGYNYIVDNCFLAWAEARNGGLPFIVPYGKHYTNNPTAHVNGGHVLTIPYIGDATGVTFSFSSPQTHFNISSAGVVTRKTGDTLTDDYYELPVVVTRGVETRTTPIRLSIGSSATASSRVFLDGAFWMVSDVKFDNTTTTGKSVTLVMDLEFTDSGQDATQLDIFATAAQGGIVARRLSTGTFRVFVRDANNVGVSVASLTSTQLCRVANGRRRIFFSVNTATSVARLVIDDTAAVTSAPTADLLLNTGGVGDVRLFTALASGNTVPKVRVGMMWCAEGYLDVTQQSVRNLFFDSVTHLPLDLGTGGVVSGITPFLNLTGCAGDYWHGKNQGNGGDLIGVDKGRATTLTLATQPEPPSSLSALGFGLGTFLGL
jgi:hypothetical protein